MRIDSTHYDFQSGSSEQQGEYGCGGVLLGQDEVLQVTEHVSSQGNLVPQRHGQQAVHVVTYRQRLD